MCSGNTGKLSRARQQTHQQWYNPPKVLKLRFGMLTKFSKVTELGSQTKTTVQQKGHKKYWERQGKNMKK